MCAFADEALNETFILTELKKRAVDVLHPAWMELVAKKNTKNTYQPNYDTLLSAYQNAVSAEEALKSGADYAAHAAALVRVEELKGPYLATKADFDADVAAFYKAMETTQSLVNGVITTESNSGLGTKVRKAIIQMHATISDPVDPEGFRAPADGTAAATHVAGVLAPFGQNDYPMGATLDSILNGSRLAGHGFEAAMHAAEQNLNSKITAYVNAPLADKATTSADLVAAQNSYDAVSYTHLTLPTILLV